MRTWIKGLFLDRSNSCLHPEAVLSDIRRDACVR